MVRASSPKVWYFALGVAFLIFVKIQPVQAAVIDDTFAGKQWYLGAIKAPQAWDITTGTQDVVVAVIDSGVDIDHPDLKDNIWVNPHEVADNGKDDDEDGLTDDVHGWNFVKNDGDVRPSMSSDGSKEAYFHGTAVASLIAAKGNDGIGIAGVAWNVKIMPLVVLGQDGYGQDGDIINAIRFAVAHGADIINLSFVGNDFNQGLDSAIREAAAQGVLVVSAAGNGTARAGDDLDLLPGYPACDKGVAGRGVLTVSSVNQAHQRSPYANHGSCVDLSAPGYDIFAARPVKDQKTGIAGSGYVDKLNGTSLSAPLVSGVAALLKAHHPEWGAIELAERLKDTTSSLPPGVTGLGSGIVDAAKALSDDAQTEMLGPLHLQAADQGQSPEIRVLSATGKELSHFFVGGGGDRRGLRAAFVRWTGNELPEIAVVYQDDPSGLWRIFSFDGLLLAAGNLGPIKDGLYLAAQDLDSQGADSLFMGETSGNRAWLVSRKNPVPTQITTLAQSMHGVVALSVSIPVPSFLVVPAVGSGRLTILGDSGKNLSNGSIKAPTAGSRWVVHRTRDTASDAIFDLSTDGARLVFSEDASGLELTKGDVEVTSWLQSPSGEPAGEGWREFEVWPR